MVPATVLSALGVTFEDLLSSVASVPKLESALDIARGQGDPRGVFNRFVGQFYKDNPGTTRAAAQRAYGLAKAWTNLGSTWARLAPETPIDPNLYRPSDAYGRYAGEFGGFITRVKVTVTDPATGDTRTYGIDIRDFQSWSPADAGNAAIGSVEEIIGKSPTVGGATDLEGLDVSFEVTDLIFTV